MKPVFFPFTYIQVPVMDAMASCFKQAVVYQPLPGRLTEEMKAFSEKGFLEVRNIGEENDRLEVLVEEYKKWGELHQSGGLSVIKDRLRTAPFFDETSMSRICSEIRGRQRVENSRDRQDPLANARVFLSIAQEFDIQQDLISKDMESYEEMEQELFSNLKGEESGERTPVKIRSDLGEHLTAERIMAWARIFLADPVESGLFVTTSRSVFEYVVDRADETQAVFGPETIPLCKDPVGEKNELAEFLESLTANGEIPDKTPIVSSTGEGFSLECGLAAGVSPTAFFSKTISIAPSAQAGSGPENTVFMLVES